MKRYMFNYILNIVADLLQWYPVKWSRHAKEVIAMMALQQERYAIENR